MNKKGFIAISIIYTLFIVLLLLMILVMTRYTKTRVALGIGKEDAKLQEARKNAKDINGPVCTLNKTNEKGKSGVSYSVDCSDEDTGIKSCVKKKTSEDDSKYVECQTEIDLSSTSNYNYSFSYTGVKTSYIFKVTDFQDNETSITVNVTTSKEKDGYKTCEAKACGCESYVNGSCKTHSSCQHANCGTTSVPTKTTCTGKQSYTGKLYEGCSSLNNNSTRFNCQEDGNYCTCTIKYSCTTYTNVINTCQNDACPCAEYYQVCSQYKSCETSACEDKYVTYYVFG